MATYKNDSSSKSSLTRVHVDVIVPVHNAATTIDETVKSAMNQHIPDHLHGQLQGVDISIAVCCYNDGSTDESWSILEKLSEHFSKKTTVKDANNSKRRISSILLTQPSKDGKGRGAGYARNRAIELNSKENNNQNHSHQFLCLLDSDDTMHAHRVAEQTNHMLQLSPDQRKLCLMGCTFDRDPPDSTWHYSSWANSLSDERLSLERFREVCILQPTWFLCRSRWLELGGYVEAPPIDSEITASDVLQKEQGKYRRLIHPLYDDAESLKLAEDLRFFHDHLQAGGILRLHRSKIPLVTYRHSGASQSFRTSRRLLLQLRVLAFEQAVLQKDWLNEEDGRFIIWGAGRDGKDVVKALSKDARKRVYCFVDVDAKKLDVGRYMNRQLDVDIPIVHFSFLIKNAQTRQAILRDWEEGTGNDSIEGQIDKTRNKAVPSAGVKDDSAPEPKRRKVVQSLNARGLSEQCLQALPVVVCVAMYRTNGALEKNVKSIGRTEGCDLWHFS
jgi:glycosyltransferase involved in cell wall biosynthesis